MSVSEQCDACTGKEPTMGSGWIGHTVGGDGVGVGRGNFYENVTYLGN